MLTDVSSPRVQGSQRGLSFWSLDSISCATVLAVCLLLTWPIAETGINDDWCYTMLAWDFGHTGHFLYRGWASASVGWQAIWGAVAAHLFGYTYTAVRLSMWPIGLATAMLFHGVLRRFGLGREHAIFGTLALALSPLFLPLVDTFMTDVPGLFVLLLCLYLCQRALCAVTERSSIGWLCCAALSNIALGTVRQIAWLGILVMVPCCGYLLRRRTRIPVLTAGLWLFGVLCIVLNMHWFKYQPYTAPEAIIPRNFDSKAWIKVVNNVCECLLTLPFLCLPVLASGLQYLGPLARKSKQWFGAAGIGILLCLAWSPTRSLLIRFSPPWTGNVLNKQGIMQGGLLFGPMRAIPSGWLVLALLVFVVSTAAFGLSLGTHRAVALRQAESDRGLGLQQAATLLLPFSLAYCVLLFPRATQFVLFDRYLLALIAVALVFLLRLHQDRICYRMPLISYALLAVFALLAVAGTHDLFAMERARVQVFRSLEGKGVPNTAIRGGFELDAATQVGAWGYFNDPRILVPKTAYHPQLTRPFPVNYPECHYPLQEFVPAVHPRYGLGADDTRCLIGPVDAEAAYRTWLPWTTHFIVAATPRFP